jgi:hypothetical protein
MRLLGPTFSCRTAGSLGPYEGATYASGREAEICDVNVPLVRKAGGAGPGADRTVALLATDRMPEFGL